MHPRNWKARITSAGTVRKPAEQWWKICIFYTFNPPSSGTILSQHKFRRGVQGAVHFPTNLLGASNKKKNKQRIPNITIIVWYLLLLLGEECNAHLKSVNPRRSSNLTKLESVSLLFRVEIIIVIAPHLNWSWLGTKPNFPEGVLCALFFLYCLDPGS